MREFIDFSFCGIKSSKYNVYAISDGSRYRMPLFANFVDTIESVDGYDGEYYFGTHYTSKPRRVSCFVENVDENILRNIQNWLNPKQVGKLTFAESPYKYYIAKVTQVPEFSFIPMRNTSDNHLYTGNFEVEFTAFDPFAYSYVNSVDDYTYFEESKMLWVYDSGILYYEETPLAVVNNVTSSKNILLYNGGNARTKPIITFSGSAGKVTVTNNTTGQSFTLENLNDVDMVVDCRKGHVRVQDVLASSYHSGGFIELEGSDRVDRYTTDFINDSDKININNADLDLVGRFIAVDNDWYKIIDCNFDTWQITLDRKFSGTTDSYDISIIDLNEISISGVNLNLSSIEFDYKFCYR